MWGHDEGPAVKSMTQEPSSDGRERSLLCTEGCLVAEADPEGRMRGQGGKSIKEHGDSAWTRDDRGLTDRDRDATERTHRCGELNGERQEVSVL